MTAGAGLDPHVSDGTEDAAFPTYTTAPVFVITMSPTLPPCRFDLDAANTTPYHNGEGDLGVDCVEFLWGADAYFPDISARSLSPIKQGEERVLMLCGWYYRAGTCISPDHTFGTWIRALCLHGVHVVLQWNELPPGCDPVSDLISELVHAATEGLSDEDTKRVEENVHILVSSLVSLHWPAQSVTDPEKTALFSTLSPWLINPLIQPLARALPRDHFAEPRDTKLPLGSHHQKCAIIVDHTVRDASDSQLGEVTSCTSYVGGMDFNLQVAGYREDREVGDVGGHFYGRKAWHDLALRIHTRGVAQSCIKLFAARWQAQMSSSCEGTSYREAREILGRLEWIVGLLDNSITNDNNGGAPPSQKESECGQGPSISPSPPRGDQGRPSRHADPAAADTSTASFQTFHHGPSGSNSDIDIELDDNDESSGVARNEHDVDSDDFDPFEVTGGSEAVVQPSIGVIKTMPPVLNDFTSHIETLSVLLEIIGLARESIYIENQYFRHKEITSALLERAYNGVNVTIVVPRQTEELSDALALSDLSKGMTRETATPEMIDPLNKVFLYARYQALAPLVAAGATVLAPSGPGAPYMHSKMLIADGEKMYLGSANMCERSLNGRVDSELGIVIRVPEIVKSIQDIVLSKEYTDNLALAPYDIEHDYTLSTFPLGGQAWASYWDHHTPHLMNKELPSWWWDQRFDAVMIAHLDVRQLFYDAMYDLL